MSDTQNPYYITSSNYYYPVQDYPKLSEKFRPLSPIACSGESGNQGEDEMKTNAAMTYTVTRDELALILGLEKNERFVTVTWEGSDHFKGLVIKTTKDTDSTEITQAK